MKSGKTLPEKLYRKRENAVCRNGTVFKSPKTLEERASSGEGTLLLGQKCRGIW